jgi:hypothetical protein
MQELILDLMLINCLNNFLNFVKLLYLQRVINAMQMLYWIIWTLIKSLFHIGYLGIIVGRHRRVFI